MIREIMIIALITSLTGCKNERTSNSEPTPESSSESITKNVEENNLRMISYSHGPHRDYIRFSIEITDNDECRFRIDDKDGCHYVPLDRSVTDSMFARFESLKGISNFKEYSEAKNDTELEYHLTVYDGRYPRRGFVIYIIPVEKLPEFDQIGQWLKDFEAIYKKANKSLHPTAHRSRDGTVLQ